MVKQLSADPAGGLLRSFALLGSLDGRGVEATWDGAELAVHDALWSRAQLAAAVDLAVSAGGPPAGALDGSALDVLVTLLRACDRVRQVDFALPPGGGGAGTAVGSRPVSPSAEGP